MLDWTKLFNIVFVSVACALIVFFLVTTIVVAAKGKRKCNAFDVVVRIFSSLAFVCALLLFACAVLTMIDGDFRIVAAEADGKAAAAFIMGESVTELPMPDLFVALSDAIGSNLAAVLLICSLAALIVDCLVANEKTGKKSKRANKPQVAKSPEQLKREAELERIRRIGESAVKKEDAADDGQNDVQSAEPDSADIQDEYAEQDPPDADYGGTEEDLDPEFSFDAEEGVAEDGDSDYVDCEQPEQDGIVSEDWAEEYAPRADDNAEEYESRNVEDGVEPDDGAWYGSADGEPDADETDDEHIEPDRDIYIPQMRTIVRQPERTAPAQRPVRTEKAADATSTKPAPQRTAERKPRRTAADKPAPTKNKASAAKKGEPKPAQTPHDGKKLPVTRRYVILDRRNAVNMFGEYLKERKGEEKDKLKSSINTIIIE